MAPVQMTSIMSSRHVVDHKTRKAQIEGVAIGLCVVSFVIGVLRITLRLRLRTVSWEDGLIAVAIAFSILQSATACLSAQNGYGSPIATLTSEQLSAALMWFWWAQINYKLTIWPTKLSILFLYRRVFGDTPNVTSFGIKFRTTVYALTLFSALFCFIAIIVNVFTCFPISYYWDKSINGACHVDPFTWWLSQSLLNTVSDVIILCLPMPLVMNLLNVPLRQKLGLSMVFGLGIFVVTVTIVRITTFKSGGLGSDPTYDGAVTLCWSMVETNVAIMCASLPLLRPLIARLIPGFCGRSSNRSNSYPMAQRHTSSQQDSKPRNIHVINHIRESARPRPRSWAGVETVIGHDRDNTDQNRAPGIHKQTNVQITTETTSICGTDFLRSLSEPAISEESHELDPKH